MKESEYLEILKREASHYRRACLQFIRQTYGVDTTQPMLRRASWAYMRRFGAIKQEHLKLDVLLPLASTYSDIYHQTHFIRATLASVFCPDEPLTDEEVIGIPLCEINESDLIRKEAQALLYNRLNDLLPKVESYESHESNKPDVTSASASRKATLTATLEQIRIRVEAIYERVCNKGEGVVSGAGEGSELPPPERKRRKRTD